MQFREHKNVVPERIASNTNILGFILTLEFDDPFSLASIPTCNHGKTVYFTIRMILLLNGCEGPEKWPKKAQGYLTV